MHRDALQSAPLAGEQGSSRSANWAFRPWAELLLVASISLGIVAIWLVPKGFDGATRILGHPSSDLAKHYWNLWWFRQMVWVDGQAPFFTTYLNYPHGFPLYPIEALNMAAALPLSGMIGLPWTTNLLSILNLAFACVAMFALIRYLTESFWAGLGAGLMYGLSSYSLWTVYVGVGELSHLGWMPLALLFLFRVSKEGGPRNLFLCTLLFFLTAFACWYYALFLYLVAGVLMATDFWRGRQTPRVILRYGLVVAISLGCLLPIVRTFNSSYRVEARSDEAVGEYIRNRIGAMPRDNPDTRIDLARLWMGGREARDIALRNPYQGGRFTGLAMAVLALVGLILRPRVSFRFALAWGLCLLLGLGSFLVVAGDPVGSRLPFAYFNLLLQRYVQPMNFPARFMMPVTLCLVVMAGLGLAELEKRLEPMSRRIGRARAKWVLSALILLLAAAPILETRARGDVRLPLPSLSVTPLPAARYLAGIESDFAVLEIPQAFLDQSRQESDELLLMQVVHGKRSSSLPIDRISAFVSSARTELRDSPLVASLLSLTGRPELSGPVCCEELERNDPQLAHYRKELSNQGIRYIVVTFKGMSEAARFRLRSFCARVFGPAVFEAAEQSVFLIG